MKTSRLIELMGLREKLAALRPDVKLKPHQQDLIARSRVTNGQIANWRPGAGKTPGALGVTEDRGGDSVVVVPASLRNNFRDSVKKFTTDDRHNNYHVYSYEQFSKNPSAIIAKHKPKTLVLDEYHRARNPGKAQAAIESIRGQVPFALGLTGSLVNNHPTEIVPLVNMIAGKKIYEGETDFTRKHIKLVAQRKRTLGEFITRKKAPQIESVTDPSSVKRMVGDYVHRYTGDKDFLKDFPTVKHEQIDVPMTKPQWELYQNIMKRNPNLARKIKNNLPPSKTDLANMNSFSVAVRQISNSPISYDMSVKDPVAASPKMKRMVEEQHRLAKGDPDFRGVVYSNFLASGVEPVTKKLNDTGLKATTFQGGMSDSKRQAVVSDYNAGKTKVLGISPAGGEGLDLKGTRLLQMMEDHWNPERSTQVEARGVRYKSHAHLPVAKRNVTVQRFVSTAPESFWHRVKKPETTIDQWIINRRKEKDRLNQEALSAL